MSKPSLLIFVLWARTILSRADFYIFRHAQCKNNAASFRLPPLFPFPKTSPRRALPLLGEVPSARTGERGRRSRIRADGKRQNAVRTFLFSIGSLSASEPSQSPSVTAPPKGEPRAWTMDCRADFGTVRSKNHRSPPNSTSVIPRPVLKLVVGIRSPWDCL